MTHKRSHSLSPLTLLQPTSCRRRSPATFMAFPPPSNRSRTSTGSAAPPHRSALLSLRMTYITVLNSSNKRRLPCVVFKARNDPHVPYGAKYRSTFRPPARATSYDCNCFVPYNLLGPESDIYIGNSAVAASRDGLFTASHAMEGIDAGFWCSKWVRWVPGNSMPCRRRIRCIFVQFIGALYVNATLSGLNRNDVDSPFWSSGTTEGPFASPRLLPTVSPPVSFTCLLEDLDALRYSVDRMISAHKTEWKGEFGLKTMKTWLRTKCPVA